MAGVTMLLLAAVLAYVAFPNRVNRAFALYLLLRGAVNILGALSDRPLAGRLYPYYQLGATFALLWFALIFYERRVLGRDTSSRQTQLAGWGLLGAAIVLEALHLVQPDEWISRGAEGARAIASALLVLLLAYRATTLADARRRSAALLFAVGLGLDLFYNGIVYTWRGFSSLLVGVPPGWLDNDGILLYPAIGASLVALLGAVAILARRGRTERSARLASWAFGAVALTAIATIVSRYAWNGEFTASIEAIVDGVWTLAFPLLVAYAVLRHSMFDVDVKARFVMQQGTFGIILVGAAAVATEIIANTLNARLGLLSGGVAAGLVLLAFEPLQRFGRGLAARAIPPPPIPAEDEERRAAYFEAVEIAYSDGALSPKDRRQLELARARLGLSPADAHMVEVDVATRLSLA